MTSPAAHQWQPRELAPERSALRGTPGSPQEPLGIFLNAYIDNVPRGLYAADSDGLSARGL